MDEYDLEDQQEALFELGDYMDEIDEKNKEELLIFPTTLESLGMSWRDFY